MAPAADVAPMAGRMPMINPATAFTTFPNHPQTQVMVMKSHLRLSSLDQPVHFLKMILSDHTGSTGIRLPEKFTKEHGKYLSKRVTLKVPTGDVWEVDLHKSGDEIWLKNGWGEFVEHFKLGISSLLVFNYESLPTLGVNIFDATASEIEYPENRDHLRTTSVKRHHESKTIILNDDDDDDNNKEHVIKISGECSTKRQRRSEGRLAIEKAKANFKCDKPFFMVYINESHLTSRRVCLPARIKRKLFRGYKHSRKCLLQLKNDVELKAWKVVAQGCYLGSADWLMFVEDNGIKIGDICAFELIHKGKTVFDVTILRSAS